MTEPTIEQLIDKFQEEAAQPPDDNTGDIDFDMARAALVERYARMEAENQRLNAECDGLLDKISARDTEAMELRNEAAQLRYELDAENQRLRAARAGAAWVPVHERLPEDLQIVLVFGTTGNLNRKGFDTTWMYEGYWVSGYIRDIIAWMPLPEPYKAQNDE